ncbi:MAG: YafY family transcriptional regulator [Nitrospinae bacterium]|nr:YafY family transcriptional regulator [Nitrospinota bacterium]
MDRTERFQLIDQALKSGEAVPLRRFMDKLEISRATARRDIEYMKDRLGAPIIWDSGTRGYRLDMSQPGAGKYELPGLWFGAGEIHALIVMHQLLSSLGPGLLEPHIKPLLARLDKILGSAGHSPEEVRKRINVIPLANRTLSLECFETVATATLKKRRLRIVHYRRQDGSEVEREVSPQRLAHYRDNWYMDAYCHLRNEIRSFAVDSVKSAKMLSTKAKNVEEKTLDSVLGAGYGIFSGRKVSWAKLKFTPGRARWVSSEKWHPKQKSGYDADGFYILEVPYSDDRELMMDILKYGPDVEVMEPEELRGKVAKAHDSAFNLYKIANI